MKLSSFTKPSNNFAGNVMKLASGTAAAQFIVLLASPILTRLFAPEAWGVLAIFTSITGIFGVIACMRYELSIMLPEKDEEAANLFGVSLFFSILISLLTVPIIWWGKESILRVFNAPGLGPYLWLVPAMVFIHGVFLALNYWNSRTKHFGRLSIARVISSLATTFGKLGFGTAGYATAGTMIGATVAGQAVAATTLGGQIWRDDRKIFFKSIRLRRMREGIIRHKKFPIFGSWSALMNTISSSLPALMLAAFFSPAIVGFFALGHRLLSLPMSLIGGAIAQVFFQRAAEAKHQGTLHLVVGKIFNKLLSFGIFPLLVIMIAGKEIFSVIFGSQWETAGLYAQILAPWIMFQFISSPMSTLFSVLEMQGTGLFFNSILLVTRIASLAIGGLLNSVLIALMLFSFTGAILYLGLCLLILTKSGVKKYVLVKDILGTGMVSFIAIIPVIIFVVFSAKPLYSVIVAGLSFFLYLIILYFRDNDLQTLLRGFFNKAV
jgi:lipopolysaccharide exporter